MPFDLLIFDCDGVLVDSEWLVARIEVETRAEFGQHISIEEYIRRYVGLSTRSPEYLASLEGLPTEFRDIMKVRVERAFHEELEAISGVPETLDKIKHVPKAIASSSSPHEIEMMLDHVGVLHHFLNPPRFSGGARGGEMYDETTTPKRSRQHTGSSVHAGNIFSVSMVAQPKPAPDVYLFAAEQNNVLPSRCIVIEDSVVGATAALTAGMTVWGFTGARHQTESSKQRLKEVGVHKIFNNMKDLPQML